MKSLLDRKIKPMLANSAAPFDSPQHLFEIKWDGTRSIAFLTPKGLRLQNRRLLDITHRYPELQTLSRALSVKEAIFDGELVVFLNGKPNFEKLQEREHVEREERISILARMIPATYVAFDILYLDGHELMKEPLERRKNILREVIKDECLPYIIESKYVLEQGKRFFEEIKREGLEGVMAKRLNSPYVEGKRTSYWVKIKAKKVAECFICGYTEGEGGRKRSFGAILVGEFDGDRLTYRGSVGTGFDAYELEKLSTLLASIKSETPTLEYFPGGKKISWVKPLLKCKVEFTERTRRGHFRQPSFKGIIE